MSSLNFLYPPRSGNHPRVRPFVGRERLPSMIFWCRTRTYWSRSFLVCSWWKPRACRISWAMLPTPQWGAKNSGCSPPTHPKNEEHLRVISARVGEKKNRRRRYGHWNILHTGLFIIVIISFHTHGRVWITGSPSRWRAGGKTRTCAQTTLPWPRGFHLSDSLSKDGTKRKEKEGGPLCKTRLPGRRHGVTSDAASPNPALTTYGISLVDHLLLTAILFCCKAK